MVGSARVLHIKKFVILTHAMILMILLNAQSKKFDQIRSQKHLVITCYNKTISGCVRMACDSVCDNKSVASCQQAC